MLRYQATEMFIQTFDSLSHIYNDIDNNLLWFSIYHNNVKVFKYLCALPNMCPRVNTLPPMIYNHSNLEILQQYLAITGYHSLPLDTLNRLAMCVDSGNEQFVRLMIKQIKLDLTVERPNSNLVRLVRHDFKRRGVSVSMLRMLHEEFNCLFGHTSFWEVALKHSIKCNMVDSVQYILKSMPEYVSSRADHEMHTLIKGCFHRCAKHDNANMFKVIVDRSRVARDHLREHDIRDLIKVAWDRSHKSFIKHLIKHHVGNSTITQVSETYLLNCVEGDTLRVTPLSVFNSDALAQEHIQQITDTLTASTCLYMSKTMATLISIQRNTNRLRFVGRSIINMVEAVGKPHSKITADTVCQFIVNCDHEYIEQLNEAMHCAAGYSAELLRLIHTHFNQAYDHHCLVAAIAKNCRSTMSLLLQQQDLMQSITNDPSLRHKITGASRRYILGAQSSSLEDIMFILDKIEWIASDPNICISVMKNDIKVFEHVLNMFQVEQLEDKTFLSDLITQSLKNNKPNIVDVLHQRLQGRLDVYSSLYFNPNIQTLHEMAIKNAYLSLEYHFNSSTFTSLPIIHRLRTINSIMDKGYRCGVTRVIKLCAQFKSITINQPQTYTLQSVCSVEITKHTCSRHLETMVHTVFGDRKLGMMIMDQIGAIHKSLEISPHAVIKGSKLLDNHRLHDYIKYGATEWFLKAYHSITPTPSSLGQNKILLEAAFVSGDARMVDALLDNPNMTLSDLDLMSEVFMKSVSSCRHPEWERMFDEYIRITCQSSQLELVYHMITLVRHPSFIHKLIQSGVTLPSINNSSAKQMAESWMTSPTALEMFQMLRSHNLLSLPLQSELCLSAIELHVTPIVKYFVETSLVQWMDDVLPMVRRNTTREYLFKCCEFGRVDHLDLLLSFIQSPTYFDDLDPDAPDGTLGEAFQLCANNGHCAMIKKLYSMVVATSKFDQQRVHDVLIRSTIKGALDSGHLDVVDFLLETSSDVPAPLPSTKITIDSVDQGLLSIGLIDRLIERLQAHPYLECKFGQLLGAAIRVGNKLVIQPLMDGHGGVINDYDHALEMAAQVGDLQSIKMIMDQSKSALSHRHICLLIDHIGSSITEDEIIQLSISALGLDKMYPSREDLYTMLFKAASKSVTVIRMVINNFTNNTNKSLTEGELKGILKVCIKRDDLESIDCLIQLALDVGVITKHDVQDLLNAEHVSSKVLAYLFEKGYLSVDAHHYKSDDYIRLVLVDWACSNGKLDIIRTIHQRCTTSEQLQRHLPSIFNILQASLRNHYQVLRYLFECDDNGQDTPFQRAGVQLNMIQLLTSVRRFSCDNGNLKIISMCDRLLSGLGQRGSKGQQVVP
ncbi:hypothetical protein SAMD00019534_100640 [Acytostelium subglobosum LB1]|uniref:hypothetical protein n=1 Tax=Acytostelium subglobosum LB1 TaxID=1410327 RepID=UPI0006448822|nr:hypothetical protein SAMD00019534_100640 [Acytostelium subglobosum LB1]GAM26889.1 hypothetical protein SAMD00019534_100640 [Acytostelium subglobosum LB1]|eukprot:XP_012750157.1 hypothetical protein SAMD00019534_100640 [Acytostelium subglobosum LB1]